jgi:uncharacterized protein YndB with AHSA1/START domain
MKAHHTKEKAEFTFVQEFNAPKKVVFNAFGNAEALNEWWGPVETQNSVIKLDFRPGGIFHFKMASDGGVSYGRFLFREVKPYDLLEFTNAFADENANVVKAPFGIPLPLEILYRLVFTENKGKTTITMTGQPVDATPEEVETFRSIEPDMQRGFGATFDKLITYLDKQK